MENCCGQGYDGAGNMAGKCNGAATRIQQEHPKALYAHCKSHLLNLCVASSCTLPLVRNMMSHVRVVSQFFNAQPKRFALLTKMIPDLVPNADHTHLIDVCRTLWIARLDGIDVFMEIIVAVVASLEAAQNNDDGSWNNDSIKDGNSLFHATVSFESLICLVTVCQMLQETRPLTKQLQATQLDVIAAVENINLLYASLRLIRNEMEEKHQILFDEAKNLAGKLGTVPSRPRTARIKVHRESSPADNPCEYYRRVLSIPFFDHLTNQIQTRFSERMWLF